MSRTVIVILIYEHHKSIDSIQLLDNVCTSITSIDLNVFYSLISTKKIKNKISLQQPFEMQLQGQEVCHVCMFYVIQ
jgi:hypothetical protein